MPAGVAAGHPATAEVGLRVLARGRFGRRRGRGRRARLLRGRERAAPGSAAAGSPPTTTPPPARSPASTSSARCRASTATAAAGPMMPIEVFFGGRAACRTRSAAPASACPACRPAAARCTAAGAGCPGSGWSSRPPRWPATGVVLPAAQARTLVSVAPGADARATAPRSTRPAARCCDGGDLLFHPGLDRRARRARRGGPGRLLHRASSARCWSTRCGPTAARSVRPTWPAYRVLDAARRARPARPATTCYGPRTTSTAPCDTLARAARRRWPTMSRPARAVAVADALRDVRAAAARRHHQRLGGRRRGQRLRDHHDARASAPASGCPGWASTSTRCSARAS